MSLLFSPSPTVSLPLTHSSDRFPVRRIYCVGKNYTDHVSEMGGNPKTSTPLFFTKSRETLAYHGNILPIPTQTENLHHEVELVVAIGEQGIWGYGVGLDMTCRDLQAQAKDRRGPWDMSKNFAHSAPCSALTPLSALNIDGPYLKSGEISLHVNGQDRQSASLSQMIWDVEAILKALTPFNRLQAGDLIFTGTPAGVGLVKPGDQLKARITGLADLDITYAKP